MTSRLYVVQKSSQNTPLRFEPESILEDYEQPLTTSFQVGNTSIRESPQNYILCFSFFDMKPLLDIKPEGGTYIYSGCEAFNEEMEIDFYRLWHWLKRFNIDSCSFSLDEKGDPCFDKSYHASGHAPGEDITWVIDQIDPDYIVPIHTEARDWFARNFENVILVDEGRPQDF